MRCFFLFPTFFISFYITIVQREKKSGNQRKREKQKKKQRPKREKSNNANESSHQLNKEKTQCDIIFVSLLFYQCTLNFFSIFQLIFLSDVSAKTLINLLYFITFSRIIYILFFSLC